MRRALTGVICCAASLLCLAAFHDSAALNGDYHHVRAGVSFVPMGELVFLFWYLSWGGLAMVLAAHGIYLLASGWLSEKLALLAQRADETLVIAALPLFAGILALRYRVLGSEPVADDELVYELTAKNLALGRLTSVPPIDVDFLRNQFVIIDAQRWHGKYPIGHSLLLAPFELLDRVDLLGACLALASMALTYALARRFVGPRAALWPPLLLALSPHFLLTHATLMSQTTSCMLALLAAYASVRHGESGELRWLLLMGGALGFGILTRPLPGLLIAAVIAADKAWEHASEPRRALREGLVWGAPVLLFGLLFLLVNHAQSARGVGAGYTEVHSGLGAFENVRGELPNSLGGALVRENAWLFGWPCSLLFVPFARLERALKLAWGIIFAVLLYRVLVPKTVVASTGPIYMTEMLPWLCIVSVAGMRRAVVVLGQLELRDGPVRVAALAVAGFLISASAFMPVQLRELARGARARDEVKRALFNEGTTRALVFCNMLVDTTQNLSWAYFPPSPWPDLRDDVLYLRIPPGPDGPARAMDLWRTRFSDRDAFVYRPFQDRGALLRLQPERLELLVGQSGS